jgi:hypothetical protein
MAAAVASLALASNTTPSSFRRLCVGQHVHQVRDRRALVAADIPDAGLQQRLGDGQNSLTLETFSGLQLQRLNFLGKRTLRHATLRTTPLTGLLAD